jgi:hypothetical protein
MFSSTPNYPFSRHTELAQLSVVEKVAIRKGILTTGTMPVIVFQTDDRPNAVRLPYSIPIGFFLMLSLFDLSSNKIVSLLRCGLCDAAHTADVKHCLNYVMTH